MRRALYLLLNAFWLCPASVRACAACYGQSDSPMAKGMNWGIMSLLGIIIMVLAGVAGFFIHLVRRSDRMPPVAPTGPMTAVTNEI